MTTEFCPKCKTLVKAEAVDAYTNVCPVCTGQTRTPRPHEKRAGQAPQIAPRTPAPVSGAAIPPKLDFLALAANDAPLARAAEYAYNLTKRIAADHGRPCHVAIRNRQVSCAMPDRATILYGWASLRCALRDGYSEYPSIWLAAWDDCRIIKGLRGVHRLTLHECAHLLAVATYGSVHNASFVTALRELRELYPEAEALA